VSRSQGLCFLTGLRVAAGEIVGVSVEFGGAVAAGLATGNANVGDGEADAGADAPGPGDGKGVGLAVGEGAMMFSQ
jgi:hypothetical protein